ncbi:MAG: hypothetical protein HOM62_22025 [Rhodospirillaceae bacterium]|jgi:hypothetical protein|nr:hypothetical protein [Rhodospirillaceae bacterium]
MHWRTYDAINDKMDKIQADILVVFIAGSKRLIDADITVQTCWDADRLDLGRAGIVPDPRYLCTDAAKEPRMIEWAHNRATKI